MVVIKCDSKSAQRQIAKQMLVNNYNNQSNIIEGAFEFQPCTQFPQIYFPNLVMLLFSLIKLALK